MFKMKAKILSVVLSAILFSNMSSAKETNTISDKFWAPSTLDLSPLRMHGIESNPYGPDFNYSKEFNSLNLEEVKKDILITLTTSQDWWPADYGNYGPFFIRMAWHGAGTYRVYDGRGGRMEGSNVSSL